MEDGRGQRFNDPFYFLQQVFSLIGDEQRTITEVAEARAGLADGDALLVDQFWASEYDQYANVTLNVWLFKGSHHFIQCLEHLDWKYYNFKTDSTADASDQEILLASILCKNTNNYFPLKKNIQKYDNVKFYVRPLECKLRDTYFKNMETFGPEDTFEENCVDFEAGDAKP